jgi:hypothetical protein
MQCAALVRSALQARCQAGGHGGQMKCEKVVIYLTPPSIPSGGEPFHSQSVAEIEISVPSIV